MTDILLNLLVLAYAATGIISLTAYWPTIKDLYFYKKKSANIQSYAIWMITTGITVLYSMFVLADLPFRIVAWVNFICVVIILTLSVGLSRKIKK